MAKKQVGKVSHYYDKIGVAVIEATSTIKVGDTIHFKKGETEFDQTIDSMQVEHKQVKSAKKGDSVGLKTDQSIRSGAKVFQT